MPSRTDLRTRGPQQGFPESGGVLCCFDGTCKITPNVFDIWMRLLGGIDSSVLRCCGCPPRSVRIPVAVPGETEKRTAGGLPSSGHYKHNIIHTRIYLSNSLSGN